MGDEVIALDLFGRDRYVSVQKTPKDPSGG